MQLFDLPCEKSREMEERGKVHLEVRGRSLRDSLGGQE